MSTHTNENDPAFPATARLVRHDPEQGIIATERFAEGGLTAREHAAIMLRVPSSGTPWLDAMITEARRWDAAQAVAAACMTQSCGLGTLPIEKQTEQMNGLAEICDRTADALTRQMKGGER